MTCDRCGRPTPPNERAEYGGRCEDCFADGIPANVHAPSRTLVLPEKASGYDWAHKIHGHRVVRRKPHE